MDESSRRDALQRGTEPDAPTGQLASDSLRSGVRFRRRGLVLGAAISAAAVAAISLVAVALTSAPGRLPTTVTAMALPAPGPSARQLAHGKWVPMPPAPLKMCGDLAVWDGRELVVIEGPFGGYPLAAAAYDPRANRWTTIPSPPILKHQWAVAAFGGGRIVLVVNSGASYSWSPATRRWRQLGSLPAGENRFSIAWSGSTFLVTRLYRWKDGGPVQTYKLARGHWESLPDLPQPETGRMQDAPVIASKGGVYVLANIVVPHRTDENGQPGSYETGYAELLRLTTAGWIQVPLGPGAPKSEFQLTRVRGAILAAGSFCGAICLGGYMGGAALLRPGSEQNLVRLKPPPGVPYPCNFAAGARAIVVTYTAGLGGLPGHVDPPPGICYIYDVTTGTWQPGPTAPAAPHIAGPAYWTPYGVISLGVTFGGGKVPALAHIGGWLLRPAGQRSAPR